MVLEATIFVDVAVKDVIVVWEVVIGVAL